MLNISGTKDVVENKYFKYRLIILKTNDKSTDSSFVKLRKIKYGRHDEHCDWYKISNTLITISKLGYDFYGLYENTVTVGISNVKDSRSIVMHESELIEYMDDNIYWDKLKEMLIRDGKTLKISEIVAKLEGIKTVHGDVDVLIAHHEDGYFEICDDYMKMKSVVLDYNDVCSYCGPHAEVSEVGTNADMVEKGSIIKKVLAIGPMV